MVINKLKVYMKKIHVAMLPKKRKYTQKTTYSVHILIESSQQVSIETLCLPDKGNIFRAETVKTVDCKIIYFVGILTIKTTFKSRYFRCFCPDLKSDQTKIKSSKGRRQPKELT